MHNNVIFSLNPPAVAYPSPPVIARTLSLRASEGSVAIPKKREIKSLLKAMDEFKIKEALVITENYDNSEEIDRKKLVFKPLWQWLIL